MLTSPKFSSCRPKSDSGWRRSCRRVSLQTRLRCRWAMHTAQRLTNVWPNTSAIPMTLFPETRCSPKPGDADGSAGCLPPEGRAGTGLNPNKSSCSRCCTLLAIPKSGRERERLRANSTLHSDAKPRSRRVHALDARAGGVYDQSWRWVMQAIAPADSSFDAKGRDRYVERSHSERSGGNGRRANRPV